MQIQRWQSLFLLIAAIVMGVFSFMSLGQVQAHDFTFNFTALGLCPEGVSTGGETPGCISTWYLFAVAILSALLPLIAIFCYKQYRLQKNLCLLTMLMLACVIIVSAGIAYSSFDGANVEWSSLVCAPFIALIAVIMAFQRIRADHRLLASVDRLR